MSAIGFPTRLAGSVVLVGVGDAPVMLFTELVVRGVRIGIAAQPELLDERVPLFIVAQILEGVFLFVGDDPDHILIEPGLVGIGELVMQLSLPFDLLLVRERALERIDLVELLPGSILRAVLGCVLGRVLARVGRGCCRLRSCRLLPCGHPSGQCHTRGHTRDPSRRKRQQANSDRENRRISCRDARDRAYSLLHTIVLLLQSPILRLRAGRGKDWSAYWTFIVKKGHPRSFLSFFQLRPRPGGCRQRISVSCPLGTAV